MTKDLHGATFLTEDKQNDVNQALESYRDVIFVYLFTFVNFFSKYQIITIREKEINKTIDYNTRKLRLFTTCLLQRNSSKISLQLDEQLLEMKCKTDQTIDALKKREHDFKQKQEQFHRQVQQFQKYVLESEQKRQLKNQQIDEEKKQLHAKQKMIEEKQKEQEDIKTQSKTLVEELKSLRQYQNYLTEVAQSTESQYSTVDDVLQRYCILQETRSSLIESNNKKQEHVEIYSKKFHKFLKDKQNWHVFAVHEILWQELLVKNITLAQCLKSFDEITKESHTIEENLHKFQNENNETVDFSFLLLKIFLKNESWIL
ncbi:hypothetical protein RFI_10470 [Reticulomyxa filosa]|uniref:DUF4200 domain-containing protein n=1 Tax=Reticulomyxa filosa TaxID=46433 RepID=X6NK25_RETFI|nr:hypothetical protein RFI_10470 [Reticulomyxa filosa]|eukprot:ETO26665.1 hypothetical protein RFI_10470 [Reticulomyxa filosa]